MPALLGGAGIGGLGVAAYTAEAADDAAESKIVCVDAEAKARERIDEDTRRARVQLRRDPTGSVFVSDIEFDACDAKVDFSEVAEDELGG